MNAINRKRAGDILYVAGGLKANRVYLYAEHLAEAHQRAIEHFRPNKRERGLIWVQPTTAPIATESL